ncbi:MAG: hypothetical protein HYV02_07110 [Deltaproteobacteria bacterium]|nr:hypothetical protein [Deltaproteobacteria bacterium]
MTSLLSGIAGSGGISPGLTGGRPIERAYPGWSALQAGSRALAHGDALLSGALFSSSLLGMGAIPFFAPLGGTVSFGGYASGMGFWGLGSGSVGPFANVGGFWPGIMGGAFFAQTGPLVPMPQQITTAGTLARHAAHEAKKKKDSAAAEATPGETAAAAAKEEARKVWGSAAEQAMAHGGEGLVATLDAEKKTITFSLRPHVPVPTRAVMQRHVRAVIRAMRRDSALDDAVIVVGGQRFEHPTNRDVPAITDALLSTVPRSADAGLERDAPQTPSARRSDRQLADRLLRGTVTDLPHFPVSWDFGAARPLVEAKIAQIREAHGIVAGTPVPVEKAEAVARDLFAFAMAPTPVRWPGDAAGTSEALSAGKGLGLTFPGVQPTSEETRRRHQEKGEIAAVIDQPAEAEKQGECTEQTAVFLALSRAAGLEHLHPIQVTRTKTRDGGTAPIMHVSAVLRRPGQHDLHFDLGNHRITTDADTPHADYTLLSVAEFLDLQGGNKADQLMQAGQLAEARALLEAVVERSPMQPFPRYMLGGLEVRAAREASVGEAAACWRRGLAHLDWAMELTGTDTLAREPISAAMLTYSNEELARSLPAQIVLRVVRVHRAMAQTAHEAGQSQDAVFSSMAAMAVLQKCAAAPDATALILNEMVTYLQPGMRDQTTAALNAPTFEELKRDYLAWLDQRIAESSVTERAAYQEERTRISK